jgi:hypothetical protein
MAKQKNRHGPICISCVYEKTRIMNSGLRGFNVHRYCDCQKPCNGIEDEPPEYKEKVVCATYGGTRGGR